MITIQVDESPDEKWNERLLTTNTGIIYHTKEYARFVEQKGWKPKFLKFLDQDEKIVGQIIISTYSRFDKKKGISKVLKSLPGMKKLMYRWVFGPVIFEEEQTKEIHNTLEKFLTSEKCHVYGSEHPLNPNVFSTLGTSFNLENWATFVIDLRKGIESIVQRFDKHSARKNIERSEKRGVTISEINEENLFQYYELLKETKSKVNWNIDFDEISFLWKQLKPVGFTGFLAKHEEIPVGGILISHFNGYINEWGVGRSEIDYTKKLYAQDLLKWHIIKWGIKNKCSFYDLTGTNPNPSSKKESGILRYKKKWGGKYIQYRTCKI